MEIKSPKDGFVAEISTSDGANVVEGAIICRIDPEDELRIKGQVEMAGQFIRLQGNLLTPEQIASRRRLIEIALEIAAKYVEYASAKLVVEKDKQRIGESVEIEVKQAETALVKAAAEKEKADLTLRAFEFYTKQIVDSQKIVQDQIAHELAYVEQKIQRLKVLAPVKGTLKLLVAKGSFIKQGQVLAEIH
jgi:biotin carboxyl carrier protein